MPLVAPRHKLDLDAARAIADADWPRMEAIAPRLLEWVQDGNWPVAQILAPALARVGSPLAPFVREVLAGDDDTWKYFLVAGVVRHSAELRCVLRPELERIAFHPTPSEHLEEVDQVARQALEA